jgi:hypothetical protein
MRQLGGAALLALWLAAAAWTGEIVDRGWNGVLRDQSGDVIAGATVELHSANRNIAATTAGDGSYRFAALPAGSYRLSITVRGKQFLSEQPLQLPVGNTAELVLSRDGSISADLAPKTEASGGETLLASSVSAIPLNKRDFSQLLLLAAGTMTDANGTTNFTQQFAVNGQRGVEAVFAMDGADISDPEMGGATFSNFNVDAVEEIQSSSG